ncbi:integrase [Halobacteriales archaeon QS_5_70_17]|nr:MAG: integrase [Halobacteriales archaeon QS_5_70_17]
MADSATDAPVAYFLEDLAYHGRAERTRTAYERVLRRFEAFLADRGAAPAGAGRRECLAFVHDLRGDHAPSTVATYATYVHRFYEYMVQAGAFDGNPMALVMAEMDESVDTDPARRDVSVPAMRAFVGGITHPLERALVLTLLKTGMRVGELVNLDRRDLALSGVGERPRAELDGRGDSLFVASDVARGGVVNGEERAAANKRERATVVPVDGELRRALIRWLTARPDPCSPADPLFVDTGDRWGERLTTGQVRSVVRRHAEARGWYREGGGASENVTPHYFRHFFTTHLRDRTGDRGIVKYLRGDVASDVIDTYTHNWGDRVREVYEANIYSLI